MPPPFVVDPDGFVVREAVRQNGDLICSFSIIQLGIEARDLLQANEIGVGHLVDGFSCPF